MEFVLVIISMVILSVNGATTKPDAQLFAAPGQRTIGADHRPTVGAPSGGHAPADTDTNTDTQPEHLPYQLLLPNVGRDAAGDRVPAGDFNAVSPLADVLNSADSLVTLINGGTRLYQWWYSFAAKIQDMWQHPLRAVLKLIRQLEVPLPDGVSDQCRTHVRLFVSELLGSLVEQRNPLGEWSLQMLDAIAKPPPGLLRGTLVWPGSFSQCVNLVVMSNGSTGIGGSRLGDPDVAFVGEHCVIRTAVRVVLPDSDDQSAKDVNMSISMCFPSTCDLDDKQRLMEFVSKPVNVTVVVEETMCRTKDHQPMDTIAILLSIVLMVPVALVLLATAFEHCTNTDRNEERVSLGTQVLLSFSAYRSFSKLFAVSKPPNNTFNFLLGIRFLSVAWVVHAHCGLAVFFSDMPWEQLQDVIDNIVKNINTSSVYVAAIYSVETFLFLSGFCAVYFFLQSKKSRKISLSETLGMYLMRYIRLTPSLAFVVAFVAGPWKHLWNGPYWFNVSRLGSQCRQLWWTDLLYVGNLVHDGTMSNVIRNTLLTDADYNTKFAKT